MSTSADQSDTFVPISRLTETNRWLTRLKALREFYSTQFRAEPEFFIRVPGRVNLIGEHVDYCGYPVLPMAIDQCILLAVGHTQQNSYLQLRNIDEKYENFECDLNAIQIGSHEGGPQWYKYFLCGIKGIYETLREDYRPIGMTIALSGNIPPAAGLSSSSALVSSAALATAFVHEIPLNCKFLASVSAKCERYIGTAGGGMDQAIAFLAKAGCAQFIEFYPELKATSIQLPPHSARFVVANSLSKMNKAGTSDFNQRVVECRLGCRMIAKQMNFNNWKEIINFAHLQAMLGCDLIHFESLALNSLTKEIYSRDDLIHELEISIDQLENVFLTENTRNMTHFKIRQRTLHVIQESQRVIAFRATCEALSLEATNAQNRNGNENGNGHGLTPAAAKGSTVLSQLMCQSHSSLSDLFECSHPDLDRLVRISKNIGVGARLTGAGWGGCIVALCDSQETTLKYIEELKRKFYDIPNEPHLDDVLFATLPSSGAEIFIDVEGDFFQFDSKQKKRILQ